MKIITRIKTTILLLCIICLPIFASNDTNIIWKIGDKDKSAKELSLGSKSEYKDFLKHDFGWEDQYYLVGESTPQKDWPYVLPGPADGWAGTSGLAGWRTHFLNILFRMQEVPNNGNYKLIIDILDTSANKPPLFKITVNGKSWKFSLPKGDGDTSLNGDYSNILNHTIEIPLTYSDLKKGGNEINVTSIEGSWLIFDDIRLEGPSGALLQDNNSNSYLRSVDVADYEITDNGLSYQPLLVDIEHITGVPNLNVIVDGESILNQQIEKGRYLLEAPMKAVRSKKNSEYIIEVDGKVIESGSITRSKQNTATHASYVNTLLGTAHSRWMIAPGPWMPFSMVKLSPDNQNAGWQAGYEPSFESIGTFSHIHEWTMGGLGIMPVNGKLITKIGDQSTLKSDEGYRSTFNKETEEAKLGYYSVELTDYNIKAELTSTSRCGFQRYTYPKATDSRVMIDLKIPCEYNFDILDAKITQVGKRRVEGYSKQQSKTVWSAEDNQDYIVHFVIEFDQDIKKFGGWINDDVVAGQEITAQNPNLFGAYVEFDTRQKQTVQVRSSISYVDMDGARTNLEDEIIKPFGWSFDNVLNNNIDTWNDIFSRISINNTPLNSYP